MSKITEEWARTAPAGADLDRVCAEWMGIAPYEFDLCGRGCYRQEWPPYSYDWSAAGPLLEAMGADILYHSGTWECEVEPPGEPTYGQKLLADSDAKDPTLAIARACAVLVARGIAREDLG